MQKNGKQCETATDSQPDNRRNCRLVSNLSKGRPDRSRGKRPEKRFTPCKGNQKAQRAVVALSGPSDLQTHMLQLKRGGRDKRGQRIGRLAGGPPSRCIGRGQGNQIVRQYFGRTGGVVVGPVLLKGDTLVWQRLLAAPASTVTNATRLPTAAATLCRGLGTMRRTVSCRQGRSAKTRLAATQPDRNQAGDE